jgi:glucuronate isomerase
MANDLLRLPDKRHREGKLAKTILYSLNPRDNDMIAAMLGNFQESPVVGKIQFGSGWWFLDRKYGMRRR